MSPQSSVARMRKRLQELSEPIYGAKEVLWARLSKAEARLTARREKMEELRHRRERAMEERPTIGPRVVARPAAPTDEEREAHELLHMTPAPWCESCIRWNHTPKPRRSLSFAQKDVGKARVVMDYAYLKTDGE